MPELERGVFYGRKSNEDDGGSIEQQRDWGRTAAQKEGVELVREFADQAKKGWDTASRTEFHDMLAFCQEQAKKKTPIRVIVTFHTNRFSRADSIETGHFLHLFRQAGVGRILTAQKWIDLGRGEDRIIFGVNQEAGDHKYVIDLSQAVLRGKLDAAREGRWNGGRANLGYRLVYDGVGREGRRPRLVIHEEEAALVREMFRAYAAGETSLYRIARDLNARGIKPVRALAWSPTTVRAILVNEVYLGAVVWNKTEQGQFFGVVDMKLTAKRGAKHTAHPCARRPKGDHVQGARRHEAIIDPETFERVQQRLVENRKGRNRADRADYALRGLLRCGVCHKPMVGKRAEWGDRGLAYRCGTYNVQGPGCGCGAGIVPERPLVICIARKLQAEVFNKATLKKLRQEMLDALTGEQPGKAEEARLRRELTGLEEKLATASERFLTEKDATAATFHRATFGQLLTRKAALEADLKAAEARHVEQPDVEAVIEKAMEFAGRLDLALSRMDAPTLRTVFRDLLSSVEVFFRTERRGNRECYAFLRGMIYVRAGVLPDLSTAACRDPGTPSASCRMNTSSDRLAQSASALRLEITAADMRAAGAAG